MHPIPVRSFLLPLALALTPVSPVVAQRIDARISDLDGSEVQPGALPVAGLGTAPGVRRQADSTSEPSASPFWSMATAGRDHGVNPLEAALGGIFGFREGVGMAELLDDRASDALLVPGPVAVQGLTAATLGSLFAD